MQSDADSAFIKRELKINIPVTSIRQTEADLSNTHWCKRTRMLPPFFGGQIKGNNEMRKQASYLDFLRCSSGHTLRTIVLKMCCYRLLETGSFDNAFLVFGLTFSHHGS